MNNELIPAGNNNLVNVNSINNDTFISWINFLDVKQKTVETYTRAIRQFIKYLSEHNITRPAREDIINYKSYLIGNNNKASTIQAYIMAIKQFFKWTEQQGIYKNIAINIKGAKQEQTFKKDYLTTKQVNKLLKSIDTSTAKGMRDYAIILLMITTGLRTIEVARANIEDIRTVADFTALYIQGKGRDEKTDYVKLSEPVENAIRQYLAIRTNIKAGEPLFSSIANRNNSERMTTRSISRIAKDNLINANLISDKWTAHSLRHTTATLNLLNGASIEETKQLLRHSNINTTLIYSHALERAKNNSEDRITQAIFNNQ